MMEARKAMNKEPKVSEKSKTAVPVAPLKEKKKADDLPPMSARNRRMLRALRKMTSRKAYMRYWKRRLMTFDTGYSVRRTMHALRDIEDLTRMGLAQFDMECLEIAVTCILRIAFAELLCNVVYAKDVVDFLSGDFVTEAIRKVDRKNVMYRLMQSLLKWNLLLERRKAGTVKKEVRANREMYLELLDKSEDRALRRILARDIYACMETLASQYERCVEVKDREILLRRISLLYVYFDLVMLSAKCAEEKDLKRLFDHEPEAWQAVWKEFHYDYKIWLRTMDEQD